MAWAGLPTAERSAPFQVEGYLAMAEPFPSSTGIPWVALSVVPEDDILGAAREDTQKKKKVRRCFTLYWIPLFPLNTLGEFVECGICAQGYDPAILDHDPANSPKVVLSNVHVAATRLMAAMVLLLDVADRLAEA